MINYPIVQIIARVPSSWYEVQYELINPIHDDNINNKTRFVSLIFYSIFVQSAGIGFFIVILVCQRNAYKVLKSLFTMPISSNDENSLRDTIGSCGSGITNAELTEMIIEIRKPSISQVNQSEMHK